MGGLSQYIVTLTFLVLLTIITMMMLGKRLHHAAYSTQVNYSSPNVGSHDSTASNFGERYTKYKYDYIVSIAFAWSV